MTKYHETEAFKRLQKAWYGKLKETGFVDIEHEEGGGLAAEGQVKSVTLSATKLGGRGGADRLNDMLDAENPLVAYQGGEKASYFRTATKVAADEIREGRDPKKAYVYSELANGVGDRTIKRTALELHGWTLTRYRIRKLANEFRRQVISELDGE